MYWGASFGMYKSWGSSIEKIVFEMEVSLVEEKNEKSSLTI